jgi:tRNA A37 methylthiotransferase MiaB
VVDRVRFIHTHAFSFSPRPGTAAARWGDDFVRGPAVNERIEVLNERARQHSLEFRQQFLGEVVEVLVERQETDESVRHGRSERYFGVHFDGSTRQVETGDAIRLRVSRVTPQRTWGEVLR